MDFLNQASGQLRDLMLSMTPAARVTALLLLGVIGVSMGYLVQHQTGGSDVDLFNGKVMSGDEIMRANAAIALKGLEGHQIVGNSIKVPAGRQSEFLGAVASGGALPPDFHKVIDKALDLSPFAGGDTRRGKYKAGRELQLSMMVSGMTGIESATVMYDIVERTGLGKKGTATASVMVTPTAGELFGPREIKNVQDAVAGGIGFLKPEQVVVTSTNGSALAGGDISAADFGDDPYYTKLLAYEKRTRNKIARQLAYIPGVQIEVAGTIGTTLEQSTQTMKPEGEAVTLRSDVDNTEDVTSELAGGGAPGLTAQAPNGRNNRDSAHVTVKNSHKQDIKQAESTVGQKAEYTRIAGMVPEESRVSISVPAAYIHDVWKEQQRLAGNDTEGTAPLPELLTTLQNTTRDRIVNAVIPLIDGALGVAKKDLVSVVFPAAIAAKEIEAPSMATQALGWVNQNFNTMTMAGVALIGLMMLRSMVKSVPASEPAVALGPSLALDTVNSAGESGSPTGNEAEGEAEGEGKRPRLKLKKGESLKDDLVDIVREDPDAAAAILRSWIGNAG